MSNSILSIIQDATSLLQNDKKNILQLSELTYEQLKMLKVGDKALLQLLQTSDGGKGMLLFDNQSIELNLTETMLNLLQSRESISIPVRIGASGQLYPIKQEQIQTQSQTQSQSEVLMPCQSNALQQIKVSPLKIDIPIQQMIQSLKIPDNIQNSIMQFIPPLNVSISQVGSSQLTTENIWSPIQNIIKQLAENPQQIETFKIQLQQAIQSLSGKQILGQVSERINDITFVKTQLGDTFFSSNIKLPLSEYVTLNINNVSVKLQSEIKFIDNIFQLLIPSKDISIKPEIIASNQQLKSLAEIINITENKGIISSIINKLPFQSANIVENIYNFYQAASNKDISRWLNIETIKTIVTEKETTTPKILQELDSFIRNAFKETPSWKIVEMPLFDGNQFSSLKVAVKKERESEKKSSNKNKIGTRFIVETDFSKLGRFQFDGFSEANKRKFDLVIRTSSKITDDFCSNVINLFKKSLYDLNYAGTIKINCQESFVNLHEENQIVKGIYI